MAQRGARLARFDCVLANPPFSLKNWGHESWGTDKWGRNTLGGIPPQGYADWAWVQHMVTSSNPKTGRIAVVLPQGALFRQGAEAKIRSHILKSGMVEAVIGLAPTLFYGTGFTACVLILRRNRPEDQKQNVLFINGEQLFRRGRNQNTFEPEHAAAILDAYTAYEDVDGLAKVVSLTDIKANSDNLNIPLYVQTDSGQQEGTLREALEALEAAQSHAAQTRAELEEQLASWGLAEDDIKEIAQ